MADPTLKYGKNILTYDPDKQIGTHQIKLVVINSMGDTKTVTATLHVVDVGFQVQLKPKNPYVFLHQQGKFTIDISSSQQEASKLNYTIQSISSNIEGALFLTSELDEVSAGYTLNYGKNTLTYDCNRQVGIHHIKVVVANSNGASKTLTTNLEVMNTDFQIQLQSKKPVIFLHQQEAKLIVDISSQQEERELSYKIKELNANKEGVTFSTSEGKEILAGHILNHGQNILYYHPNKQAGVHDIKLVVTDSNGSSRAATVTLEVVDVDFQIQFKPDKPTVFLHHQPKLIVDISSSQKEATKLTYHIKEISSNREGASFSMLEGNEISAGHALKYGKNTLYYHAAKQVGVHHIKLSIANSNGSLVTATASINMVDVDFQVQFKPDKPTACLHHQPKLIVDISCPQAEAKELTYQIKEISSNREGAFFATLTEDKILAGYALNCGKNTLCYHPVQQMGTHDIQLIVINSNDQAKLVNASINFIDADFFSQAKLEEVTKRGEKSLDLCIRVGSNEIAKEDKWELASWNIAGGTVGKLQDVAGQELKARNVTLPSAENRFKLVLANKPELTHLSQLTIVIKQPDGLEKPFVFDLSNYILADLVNNIKIVEAEMVSSSKKFIMGEKFAEEKFNRAISQLRIIKNNLGILGESDSINKNQLEDALVKVDEIFRYSETMAIDQVIYNKFNRGINEKDSYGRTPLIEAIDKNDEQGIDLVLTHPHVDLKIGHTISSKNNGAVYPTLSYAIIRRGNDLTIPTKLLKAGASVEGRVLISRDPEYVLFDGDNAIATNEWSPRHMISNQDYKGDTPLHVACEEKLLSTIKLLLANGADINAKNGYWQTPLHLAVITSDPKDEKAFEIVDYLIKQRADVNAIDLNDNTSLHYAASWKGDPRIMDILLDAGADCKKVNRIYGKDKFSKQVDKKGLNSLEVYHHYIPSQEASNRNIRMEILLADYLYYEKDASC